MHVICLAILWMVCVTVLHDVIKAIHRLHPSTLFANIDHFRVPTEPGNWRVYFVLSLAFYAGWTLFLSGGWLMSGGMWAEMSSNYYPVTQMHGLPAALFATDAGYIPLPQRLIAYAGRTLGAQAIPFYYSLSAMVLGGLCLASFCHAIFRTLIPSDAIRFLLCIVFCCIPDFETRTFINFTYLGIVYLGALVAVSLIPDGGDAPGWAWFAPFLMLSKPVTLALVPMIVIALAVAKPRFRILWSICVATAMVQAARLMISADAGGGPDTAIPPGGAVDRIASAVANGLAMVGDYSIGPWPTHLLGATGMGWIGAILTGLLLTFLLLGVMIRYKSPSGALILIGLSLVYASALLNSFALPSQWNLGLDQVIAFGTSRASFSAIVGTIMAVSGAACSLLCWTSRRRSLDIAPRRLGVLACAWFVLTGWPTIATRAAPSVFPMTGGSYWQEMADRIDDRTTPVCVPADPYVSGLPLFAYRRQCRQLNLGPDPDAPAVTADPQRLIPTPAASRSVKILGLLVVVSRGSRSTEQVRATAITADGYRFAGAREIGSDGGLLMLLPQDNRPPATVESIRLELSPGATVATDKTGLPGLIYLGLDHAGTDR